MTDDPMPGVPAPGVPAPDEPVTDGPVADVLAQPDPIAAYWQAHRHGRPVSLGTSGTSGEPRTIVRSTASWVDSFPAWCQRLGLGAESRIWVPGALRSTMNLFAAVLAESVGGSWSMVREGCSHAALTPTQLRLLLDASPEPGMHVLVAGDRLDPALRRDAEAAGLAVSHYYGAAELSLVAWGHDADDLVLFDQVEAELRERDDQGVGTLWVRSPWLADPAATAMDVDERGFATVGDLARLDGERLVLVGRPGTATTAGSTVQLSVIEEQLRRQARHPLAVVAVAHAQLGELVCCVAHPEELPALKHWARRNLAGAMRPRRWLALEDLPTTSAGKLDRPALAALL